jgi:acyl carrier protein
MSAINTDVQDRVFGLVRALLDQNSIVAQVLPASRLADIGLASMDMVNLMLGVEAEFDLTIPQSEITPDNFRSVEMIERMIVKQLRLHQAA